MCLTRVFWWLVVLVGLGPLAIAQDGPLRNAANELVRTDGNGYLLVASQTYTSPDGPLRNLANTLVRTDANGYLIVTNPTGLGAPVAAEYWVGAAHATLTAEKNLGALATGLVINTSGTPSAYGGTSCTNQFPRSLNASGAATCASVALALDVTGTLGVTNGGTGLATIADKRIPFATAANTISTHQAFTIDEIATNYVELLLGNEPAYTGVAGVLGGSIIMWDDPAGLKSYFSMSNNNVGLTNDFAEFTHQGNTGGSGDLLSFPQAFWFRTGSSSTGGITFLTQANAPIRFGTGGFALTNERLRIAGDGTAITVWSPTTATEFRLTEPSGSGTNYTGFVSPALAGNVVYTLPTADGAANAFLQTNGALVTSWSAVDLAASDVTGILPVANGGTGLASGTSGGVLGYTAAGTLASSAALTVNQLVLGGGAGATPTTLGSLGTTTTVLHGNAAGAPTFAAVSLSADVSGDLPYANLTQGSALSVLGVTGNATADVASIAAGTDNQVLRRSGTALAFGAVNVASTDAVTGILGSANGGTGIDNGGRTLTVTTNSGTLAFSSASTTLTIPATGTAALRGASNTFTVGAQKVDSTDDSAWVFDSANTTHGMTDFVDTNTYGELRNYNTAAGGGGLRIRGWSGGVVAFGFQGSGTGENTVKGATATGTIEFSSGKKSGGTGLTPLAANGNLVVFQDRSDTRWILDVEGDTHRDGTDNTFQSHEDAELLAAWENTMRPDLPQRPTRYTVRDLQKLGILGDDPGPGQRYFYNESALARISAGAAVQHAARIADRQRETEALAQVMWEELQKLPAARMNRAEFDARWRGLAKQ